MRGGLFRASLAGLTVVSFVLSTAHAQARLILPNRIITVCPEGTARARTICNADCTVEEDSTCDQNSGIEIARRLTPACSPSNPCAVDACPAVYDECVAANDFELISLRCDGPPGSCIIEPDPRTRNASSPHLGIAGGVCRTANHSDTDPNDKSTWFPTGEVRWKGFRCINNAWSAPEAGCQAGPEGCANTGPQYRKVVYEDMECIGAHDGEQHCCGFNNDSDEIDVCRGAYHGGLIVGGADPATWKGDSRWTYQRTHILGDDTYCMDPNAVAFRSALSNLVVDIDPNDAYYANTRGFSTVSDGYGNFKMQASDLPIILWHTPIRRGFFLGRSISFAADPNSPQGDNACGAWTNPNGCDGATCELATIDAIDANINGWFQVSSCTGGTGCGTDTQPDGGCRYTVESEESAFNVNADYFEPRHGCKAGWTEVRRGSGVTSSWATPLSWGWKHFNHSGNLGAATAAMKGNLTRMKDVLLDFEISYAPGNAGACFGGAAQNGIGGILFGYGNTHQRRVEASSTDIDIDLNTRMNPTGTPTCLPHVSCVNLRGQGIIDELAQWSGRCRIDNRDGDPNITIAGVVYESTGTGTVRVPSAHIEILTDPNTFTGDAYHIYAADAAGGTLEIGTITSSQAITIYDPNNNVDLIPGGRMSYTATLDFANQASPPGCETLTIPAKGARDGDQCEPGVPNGSDVAGSQFTCHVSAKGVVSMKHCCIAGASCDPASGSFAANVTGR